MIPSRNVWNSLGFWVEKYRYKRLLWLNSLALNWFMNALHEEGVNHVTYSRGWGGGRVGFFCAKALRFENVSLSSNLYKWKSKNIFLLFYLAFWSLVKTKPWKLYEIVFSLLKKNDCCDSFKISNFCGNFLMNHCCGNLKMSHCWGNFKITKRSRKSDQHSMRS